MAESIELLEPLAGIETRSHVERAFCSVGQRVAVVALAFLLLVDSGTALDGIGSADIRSTSLDEDRVVPFAAAISAWLDPRSADCVLVRPDFHVVGTGTTEDLVFVYSRVTGENAAVSVAVS